MGGSNPESNAKYAEFSPHSCTFAYGQPCHVCKEMLLLEEDPTNAHTTTADVKAQRLALRSKMNAHHDPITSKLSTEVVSHIFVKCMEDRMSDNSATDKTEDELRLHEDHLQWIPPNARRAVVSPLQLGTICRSWRQVVWSTPRIWTKLAVDLEHEGLSAAHVDLFEACLDRSGARPLHIVLRNDSSDMPAVSRLLERKYSKALRVLDILLRHISKVIDLEFFTLPPSIIQYLECDPSMRPSLERLKLSMPPKNVPGKSQINVSWDKLSRLVLKGIRLQDIDIKWNNLTHLKMRDCESDMKGSEVEILLLSPRLEYLSTSLSRCIIRGKNLLSSPIVEHKSLRYLELIADDASYVSFFLHQTAFPALEELVLKWGERDGNTASDMITLRLARSLSCLKRLTLIEVYHNDFEELTEVLEALPSLDYLELQLQEVDYPQDAEEFELFLKHLATTRMQMGPEGFLPNLAELYMHGAPSIDWSLIPPIVSTQTPLPESVSLQICDSALEALPAKKTKQARPLTTIRIGHEWWDNEVDEEDPLDRETVIQLACLLEQGITITIGEGPSPGNILQSWMNAHHLSDKSLLKN